MKSWKSASLPLCGVAVSSRKWRVRRRKELPQPVAFRVLDLVAEIGGAELVGFVADDQVPVGLLQLGLDIFVAAELVQPANDQETSR